MRETIAISAPDGTRAEIALVGSEPVSWVVAGREYLWSGDPMHWERHAPWLFPVVGASVDGAVRIDNRRYPMAQHGFARDAAFTIVSQGTDAVTLRLTDSAATRTHCPYPFRLDIETIVRPSRLDFTILVVNPGERPLPYGLGFHPAFPWPFDLGCDGQDHGHSVVFDQPEGDRVPEVGPGGVLMESRRPVPLDGRALPLDRSLFTEALVFLDAASRAMRFTAPNGAAIAMEVDRFPHLAVWTKPTAPFLSLECWTGHADMAGFSGELSERRSQILLAPGAEATHRVSLVLEP